MIPVIRRIGILLALSFLTAKGGQAHDVIVDQIVRVTVNQQGGRLAILVQIPVSLLNDAGLRRVDDGRVDATESQAALHAIAADVARNLEFRQNERPLGITETTGRVGSDLRSVDVEISYTLAGPPTELSARLNAFRGAPLAPSRTELTFVPASGQAQHLSVAGPPVRVTLDPGLSDVVRRFFVRAFDTVLAGRSHLLFLVCLLLAAHRVPDESSAKASAERSVRLVAAWSAKASAERSARLVAAVLSAQATGVVMSMLLRASDVALLSVDMIAWSAVAVAALCAIVGSDMQILGVLGTIFGLLSGVQFGASFNIVNEMAGSHSVVALLTYTIVALGIEVWLAGVIWATYRWLHSVTKSGRILTVLVSALVAHVALHEVVDVGREIGKAESFAADHAVMLLVIGWMLAMLTLALLRFARGEQPIAERELARGAFR